MRSLSPAISSYYTLKAYLTALWKIAPAVVLLLLTAACDRPPGTLPTPMASASPSPIPRQVLGTRPADSPTPPPASSLGVEAADLQDLEVEIWYALQPGRDDTLETLVEEFNGSNPWGVRAIARAFPDQRNLSQVFEESMFGEQAPDVLLASVEQALRWNAAGKVVADLNPYLDDPVWGLAPEEQQDFHPVFWQQDLVGGKRFGLPFHRSAQVLFYNLSWARELGFDDPPVLTEEFQEQACAAAQANEADEARANDGSGGWIASSDPVVQAGWIAAFGGEIVKQEERSYQFDTPEVRKAFSFQKLLFDRGCSWLGEQPYPNQEFASRRALFITSSLNGLSDQYSAFMQASNHDQWTAIAFPSAQGQPVMPLYGASLLIFESQPAKQLAAWLLVRWLVEPGNQLRWAQSNLALPVRSSGSDFPPEFAAANPQWAAVRDLIPFAQPMPSLASWSAVRLALSDASAELYSPRFSSSQVPALVRMLERTAIELDNHFR